MTIKVAINGFGRIGRLVLRAIVESGRNDVDVVAVNDLGPVETNAHLLCFDSVHGRFPAEVKVEGEHMIVGRHKIKVTAIKDPAQLPHAALGVEGSKAAFALPAPDRLDNTHHNNYGAMQLARLVALGLREARVPVAAQLRDDLGAIVPAQPQAPEQFRVAISPGYTQLRPLGD